MRTFSAFVFVLYVFLLLKLTLFKAPIVFLDYTSSGSYRMDSLAAAFSISNFIPLHKIYYYLSGNEPYMVGIVNILGNIILFVPMGIFLPFFFHHMNEYQRVVVPASGISFLIELIQLLTRTGEFDVDDILLNTIGGVIGSVMLNESKRFGFLNRRENPVLTKTNG